MGILKKAMRSQNMKAVIIDKLADRLNKLRSHLKTSYKKGIFKKVKGSFENVDIHKI